MAASLTIKHIQSGISQIHKMFDTEEYSELPDSPLPGAVRVMELRPQRGGAVAQGARGGPVDPWLALFHQPFSYGWEMFPVSVAL